MKNLLLIVICSVCFTSCAVVGESAYSSNYSDRIAISQKKGPLDTRKKAREFAQSTPINSHPNFMFEDHPRDWSSPRQPWNQWPPR